MANKELSALTAAGTLGGTEALYIVDADGNSRKVTLSDLKTFINTDPTVVPSSVPWRGAMVSRTSDLSIANSTLVAVTWQQADTDTDSFWSAGAPTRLTVPTGVTRVRLQANIRFAANTAGIRVLDIRKNGSVFPTGRGAVSANAVTGSNVHGLYLASAALSVTAGDYFELLVTQTSGGALNVSFGSSTYFGIDVIEASV